MTVYASGRSDSVPSSLLVTPSPRIGRGGRGVRAMLAASNQTTNDEWPHRPGALQVLSNEAAVALFGRCFATEHDGALGKQLRIDCVFDIALFHQIGENTFVVGPGVDAVTVAR